MSGRLLTPDELAARLGVTRSWVYAASRQWVKTGGKRGIPTVKLGRYYRYREAAIVEWELKLESGQVAL